MTRDLLPLKDGDTVCIVGGGPGGAACAITLKNEARKAGKDLRVVVLEHKRFDNKQHYNQCIGVLSPPLEQILAQNLGIRLPPDMVVKEMQGYCLHSDRLDLNLKGEEEGKTYAVARSQFDAFMLDQADKAGAEIYHTRFTGLDLTRGNAMVYSEGPNCQAAAVVGAFGTDPGAARIFEKSTPYKPPDHLSTIITRIYPGAEFLRAMGPVIHAFLLSFRGLEFGAVTPKEDHLSINIAGRHVSHAVMLEFLRSQPVQRLLPSHRSHHQTLNYFKGEFPISPARHFFGHRYVTLGDAAGLIRPFKGKGINSACLTGIHAARTMVHHGVSRKAFARHFHQDCRPLTQDLPYGRAVRWMTKALAGSGFMDPVLAVASRDPVFMRGLFNCVSGHKTYKQIFRETASWGLGLRLLREFFSFLALGKEPRIHGQVETKASEKAP